MLEIGIDRVLFKNLNICQVDEKSLKEKGFVVIQDNDKSVRIMRGIGGEDVHINYIKVSKQHDSSLVINELRVGQKDIRGEGFTDSREYEHLDSTLPRAISKTKTNENNISNMANLEKSLDVIEKELEGLGFGKVDLLKAEVKELEINGNIDLDRPFKEYERVLTYFQELLPKRLKLDTNNSYKPNEEYTGFKSGNKSVSLKMYDKRANIMRKSGQDIGKERLRIEYSFLNERKIRDTFGTIKFSELVRNDFEEIDRVFRQQLEGDLVKGLSDDIESQLRLSMREIARYKKAGVKMSGQELIFDNDILDIEIVLAALKENTSKGNYARECKVLINRSLEGKQEKLFGNIARINEILEVLGYGLIKLEMTNHIEKEVEKHY